MSTTDDTIETATALSPPGSDAETLRAQIPDGWQQGRGAFGGVVIAILTRALVGTDPERRLRSLTADLCAPAMPGDADVAVSVLRRGAFATFAEARLTQSGGLVARASAVLASARDVAKTPIRTTPPTPPPWHACPIVPVKPPFGPVFARHYEYRGVGPAPFGSGPDAIAEGWLREVSPPKVVDEAVIAARLDAWWPAAFAVEAAPRPVATIGYTMQLLCDPTTLDPSEPLFYRARAVATSDNYFVEMRELWSDGAIVAMNQQSFALL